MGSLLVCLGPLGDVGIYTPNEEFIFNSGLASKVTKCLLQPFIIIINFSMQPVWTHFQRRIYSTPKWTWNAILER